MPRRVEGPDVECIAPRGKARGQQVAERRRAADREVGSGPARAIAHKSLTRAAEAEATAAVAALQAHAHVAQGRAGGDADDSAEPPRTMATRLDRAQPHAHDPRRGDR